MKTSILFLLVTLLISTQNVESQDIMGAIRQTAEMHNESVGEDTNNNSNSANSEEENDAQWQDYMNEMEEEFKADLNGLGPYEKCAAMMMLYLRKYYDLEEQIENESDCKRKYDLYGIQLLGISASQTILYCPEKISKLSEETQKEVLFNFVDPHVGVAVDGWYYWKDDAWGGYIMPLLHEKFSGITSQIELTDLQYGAWMEWLWGHFHPVVTVSKVMEIGQKMEALGCGG